MDIPTLLVIWTGAAICMFIGWFLRGVIEKHWRKQDDVS